MNFIFRLWYVQKLLKQQSSSFKIKNEVDNIKTDCISEILKDTESLWLAIKKLLYQLGVKLVQINRARINRDEFRIVQIYPNPLFSQDQISRITRKYWTNIGFIILFIASETYLYLLIASLFIPGGSEVVKLAVSAFIALLMMQCLNFGLEQHFKFLTLKELIQQAKHPKESLKKQNDLRIIGYALILVCFIGIVFCGMSRYFFLENLEPHGLSASKFTAVQKASKFASSLTMIVTILAAIILALLKRDQSITANQYHVCRYWLRTVRRRNSYTQQIIKQANKFHLLVEQRIQAHWSLVIDLKRLFKMPEEYDEKYAALNQEYLEIKARPGHTMNDSLYRKFSPIQGAHFELFSYGILSSAEIKDKIIFINNILKQADEFLQEHIDAINHQQIDFSKLPPPTQNGTMNNQSLIPHLKPNNK